MAETVMSVGDDPQLLSLRHAVLELVGYHVISESNAQAASQKTRRRPATFCSYVTRWTSTFGSV
jgi:DNA-binding NtrC family response regulator